MQKLRLAIVAPTLRILGGQAVQADRLLHRWRDDPDVDAWLVPVNPLPPRGLRFAVTIKYLRTIVTELTYIPLLVRELAKADVVHVFSASYSSFLLAPLPAAAIARMLGRPVVFNYHSGEAPDHLARSRVARTVLAGVDRNVVPSRFLAEVFQRFGLEATVVSNTIDLDEFAFRERDPLRPRILSTRNLGYPYNVACTLRAFQEIQRRRADASLTLVGGGPDEPALRALAADLGVRNVQFRGRLAPDAIANAYADHDIYLQSPDIDNMPLSVLEAFASGLPVVSTGVGGVPVMLTHGQHGLLAPPNDHRALATHVLHLLDDPAMARRLARAARGTCDACTWSHVRNQWLRIYFSVLTETRTVEPRPRQARVGVSDES
jgi:glycosyltransferase involved in cell wall biosynthesis